MKKNRTIKNTLWALGIAGLMLTWWCWTDSVKKQSAERSQDLITVIDKKQNAYSTKLDSIDSLRNTERIKIEEIKTELEKIIHNFEENNMENEYSIVYEELKSLLYYYKDYNPENDHKEIELWETQEKVNKRRSHDNIRGDIFDVNKTLNFYSKTKKERIDFLKDKFKNYFDRWASKVVYVGDDLYEIQNTIKTNEDLDFFNYVINEGWRASLNEWNMHDWITFISINSWKRIDRDSNEQHKLKKWDTIKTQVKYIDSTEAPELPDSIQLMISYLNKLIDKHIASSAKSIIID